MLRRACYCAMYMNNFVFIEEYAVFFIAALVAATAGPITALLAITLLLFSPRFQWQWDSPSLREDPGTTRPNTGTFSVCDRGLVDSTDRLVFLRGVNINGKQGENSKRVMASRTRAVMGSTVAATSTAMKNTAYSSMKTKLFPYIAQ